MTPVNMLVKHAPPASIGDCFRCCIASLLDLPGDAVPHFMEKDWAKETNFAWYPDVSAWLAPRGLAFIELNVTPEVHENRAWFAHIEPGGFAAYHLLSGKSRRAEHCVVASNGIMVHDPAPEKDGLIGPGNDGFYAYGFLVHRGHR